MSDNKEEPSTIYLADYSPPVFLIDTVDLLFDLDETATRVKSVLSMRRNDKLSSRTLVLNGRELTLVSLSVDGRTLDSEEFDVGIETLTIPDLPDKFILEVITEINPQGNTSLGGLYTSGGNFCTQCEAEEFRKITYFLDRPDVMAQYTTTIKADKEKYPVLLSNGNLLEQGDYDDGRHWARWYDPFPKPCYLFALVAGDLACIEDTFTTQSGRNVDLHIYVQHHNVNKCDHAMRSLKNSMDWDERTYGREYDLDLYMVVAVDDFNMGAMENKGLNVFNSKYVLASPDTATDQDYQGIEGVIGHEYFHNWSGNRVTCRDWFQLSLKEGFTVYRDEEFSADMGSRGVKRIEDVNVLRTHQFREDSGPMAHPIRPESYVEINNFYTVTVYNKGAEIVRMLAHLVGPEGFRKGTDLYFNRHDGQAVTTDDFVSAIEDSNDIDFSQFKRWYSQAGTPVVSVKQEYDADKKLFRLKVKQNCPPTPGQKQKLPFHIPLAIGLLDEDGKDLPITMSGVSYKNKLCVLDVCEPENVFEFENVPREPVPSLLRGFSAPVKLITDLSDKQLYFLMGNDKDSFNRWESGQQMAIKIIVSLIDVYKSGKELVLNQEFIDAIGKTLVDSELDPALIAAAITLPSEAYISEFVDIIDPKSIHEVRRFVMISLAKQLKGSLLKKYEETKEVGDYKIDAASIGRRSFKNTCLRYLSVLEDEGVIALCEQQFNAVHNMTDVIAALSCLANSEASVKEDALAEFYEKWQQDPLVLDKWFSIQATSRLDSTLANVKSLTRHPAFSIKNPNKVRSLIGAFCNANAVRFHDSSGEGYEFLADTIIKLDPLNPQVAARMSNAFSQWRRYEKVLQDKMRAQMERILGEKNLSRDVYEVMSKSLSE